MLWRREQSPGTDSQVWGQAESIASESISGKVTFEKGCNIMREWARQDLGDNIPVKEQVQRPWGWHLLEPSSNKRKIGVAEISMLYSLSVITVILVTVSSSIYSHTYDNLTLYAHLFACIAYLFCSIPQIREHIHFIQHNITVRLCWIYNMVKCLISV